jgi:NADH-quinone oxidoreductase subunit M
MKDLNGREMLVLSVLAVAVLGLGLWPKPLTDVMEVSVRHLVEQIVISKLPVG